MGVARLPTRCPRGRSSGRGVRTAAAPGWGRRAGGGQGTGNGGSAIEVRTRACFSVEVAAREGQDVMLHRVYLYKEKVNGKLQPAKSYVVGSQMMLAQNVKYQRTRSARL
mgnify:CR=1 FL=1